MGIPKLICIRSTLKNTSSLQIVFANYQPIFILFRQNRSIKYSVCLSVAILNISCSMFSSNVSVFNPIKLIIHIRNVSNDSSQFVKILQIDNGVERYFQISQLCPLSRLTIWEGEFLDNFLFTLPQCSSNLHFLLPIIYFCVYFLLFPPQSS